MKTCTPKKNPEIGSALGGGRQKFPAFPRPGKKGSVARVPAAGSEQMVVGGARVPGCCQCKPEKGGAGIRLMEIDVLPMEMPARIG